MPASTAAYQVNEILYCFEQEFRAGTDPQPSAFLVGEGAARHSLLLELLHSHLELRIKAGQPVSVRDCLAQFPELREHPEDIYALLGTEVKTRRQMGQPLKMADYEQHYGSVLGQQVKDLFSEPAASNSSPLQPDIHLGSVVAGRYTLIRELGHGGMGTVYLAEQTQPVKRQVALKLIRGHVDSRNYITRFEAERQALAVMDHPNIARVYDGGTTEQRQPFFVMELVQGVPITQYCDQHRLPPQARLELFVLICQAVQHAHQKGIIHRDLKPSNVLVAEIDGKPVPKVIDFGLAKATEVPLTDATLEEGGIVGTPAYMSPEQADPDNDDVDTRTDIYALGVILYELLTGFTPFEAKQFRRGAMLEILRMVREEEPPKPSTKLSAAAELPSIAANRAVEPKQLLSWLRSDIDWIVMKALEKERDRRYETANGFADDVQRYLQGEVVLAHPPSRVYRVLKFIRRYRLSFIVVSLLLLSLCIGVIGTSLGLFEALRQKQLATDAAKKERQAREMADLRLIGIERGNRLLSDLFHDLNPRDLERSGQSLGDVLAERLSQMLTKEDFRSLDDELTGARLRVTAACALRGLGFAERALPSFQSAEKSLIALLGAVHPETLQCSSDHASAARDAGHFREAIKLFDSILPLMRIHLGPAHKSTLAAANSLATSYQDAGQWKEAIQVYQDTLRAQTAAFGPNHASTLNTMSGLADCYHVFNELEQALTLSKEVTSRSREHLGPEHADTLGCMNNLAELYRSMGQTQQAVDLQKQTLELRVRILGAEHPDTLRSRNNLAEGYHDLEKLDLVIPMHEATQLMMVNRLGASHPNTLTNLNNLAAAYHADKQIPRAIVMYELSLQRTEAKFGPEHPDTLRSLNNLAEGYKSANQLERALPLYERAARGLEKMGFQTPMAERLMRNTIAAYEERKVYATAETWQRKWITHVIATAGAGSEKHAAELAGLGNILAEQRNYAEAEVVLRECLAIREKKEPGIWTTFNTMSMLGGTLLGKKKYDAAMPLLMKGYQGMNAQIESIPKQVAVRLTEALDRLIQLYTETNKPDEVKKWQAEKVKLLELINKQVPSKPGS